MRKVWWQDCGSSFSTCMHCGGEVLKLQTASLLRQWPSAAGSRWKSMGVPRVPGLHDKAASPAWQLRVGAGRSGRTGPLRGRAHGVSSEFPEPPSLLPPGPAPRPRGRQDVYRRKGACGRGRLVHSPPPDLRIGCPAGSGWAIHEAACHDWSLWARDQQLLCQL